MNAAEKPGRISFVLHYGKEHPQAGEERRQEVHCRCGAPFTQYAVNPKYLANLTDGQRASFMESCVEIGKAIAFPKLCARCDRKLLGTNSRSR
jgi:hypothetical protein